MPNINAFRQAVHENKIVKVVCYINLKNMSPKGEAVSDLRNFISTI